MSQSSTGDADACSSGMDYDQNTAENQEQEEYPLVKPAFVNPLTEKRRLKRQEFSRHAIETAINNGWRPKDNYYIDPTFSAAEHLNNLFKTNIYTKANCTMIRYKKAITLPIRLRELLARVDGYEKMDIIGRRLTNFRDAIEYWAKITLPRLTPEEQERILELRHTNIKKLDEDIDGDHIAEPARKRLEASKHKILDADSDDGDGGKDTESKEVQKVEGNTPFGTPGLVTPVVLVLTSSAYRICDMGSVMKDFGGVSLFFARHQPLPAMVNQIRRGSLLYDSCRVAIGSPGRILKLIESNCFNLHLLTTVILDVGYIDKKNRTPFEYDDIRADLLTLYENHIVHCKNVHFLLL